MKAPKVEKKFHNIMAAARSNKKKLAEAGIITVSVSGGPGCGKTSLIETTISKLLPEVSIGVITCDVSTPLHAGQMLRKSNKWVQVNAGPDCVVDASHIHQAIQWLDLKNIRLLFIENVGTLACSASVDFGQNISVAMFSVAGGHGRADRYSELIKSADMVLLNKTDLLHAVPFDLNAFRADVHRLNVQADMFELSTLSGEGINRWLDWLIAQVGKDQPGSSNRFGLFEKVIAKSRGPLCQ